MIETQGELDRRSWLGWSFRRALATVVAIATAVQVASLASVWRWTYRNGDALYFQGQATLNSKGHLFDDYAVYLRSLTSGHGAIYVASANHPPLTSFVFTLADLVGLRSFHAHAIVLATVFVATVALLACTLRSGLGERWSIVAALIVATDPYLFINTGTGLAETLVLALVVLLWWCLARLWRTKSYGHAAAAGAVVSLLAQTRAELVALLVVALIPGVLLSVDRPRRRALRHVAVALLAFAAVSAPWVVRNQVTFTNSVYFSDEFGTTLADSNCQATYYGAQLAWWYLPCWTKAPVPSHGDESVIDAAREHDGLTYISHHRLRAIEVVGLRVAMAWNLVDPGREVRYGLMLDRPRWASTVGCLESYALLGLAGVGLVVRRRDLRALLVPVACIVTGTLAVAMTFAAQRYLVEAQLGTAVLATYGLQALTQRRGVGEPS